MKPGIFAKGTGLILHPWFSDRKVKVNWVAVRGTIYDWAIYHSFDSNLINRENMEGDEHLRATDEEIARLGAKLGKEDEIKAFVPCDEEAFKMYRY